MAFLNAHKTFAVKSELDLFTTKPTQNCVESGFFTECRPISVLDSDSPIEFVVCASDEYLDLSHCQIQLKVRIVREDDGGNIANNDPVAPVNNFLNSMFEHVSIELNNKTITPPSNNYHYRSYIETLLNYSHEAKSTHLVSSLFIKDEAKKMDDVTGSGFVKRKAFLNNGFVELSGFIHSELMSQDKFLLNHINMRVKFFRSKSSFCLMTTSTDEKSYKLEIVDAILLVRKVKINPSVMVAHARALKHCNAKYCLNRVDLKTISIPKDMQSKMLDNIFIGENFQIIL